MQRINRKKLISDKPLTQTVYSIVNNIPNGYTDEDTNQKYYSKNIKDKKRPNKFLSIQERQKIIHEINKSKNNLNLYKPSSPLKSNITKNNNSINKNILYVKKRNLISRSNEKNFDENKNMNLLNGLNKMNLRDNKISVNKKINYKERSVNNKKNEVNEGFNNNIIPNMKIMNLYENANIIKKINTNEIYQKPINDKNNNIIYVNKNKVYEKVNNNLKIDNKNIISSINIKNSAQKEKINCSKMINNNGSKNIIFNLINNYNTQTIKNGEILNNNQDKTKRNNNKEYLLRNKSLSNATNQLNNKQFGKNSDIIYNHKNLLGNYNVLERKYCNNIYSKNKSLSNNRNIQYKKPLYLNEEISDFNYNYNIPKANKYNYITNYNNIHKNNLTEMNNDGINTIKMKYSNKNIINKEFPLRKSIYDTNLISNDLLNKLVEKDLISFTYNIDKFNKENKEEKQFENKLEDNYDTNNENHNLSKINKSFIQTNMSRNNRSFLILGLTNSSKELKKYKSVFILNENDEENENNLKKSKSRNKKIITKNNSQKDLGNKFVSKDIFSQKKINRSISFYNSDDDFMNSNNNMNNKIENTNSSLNNNKKKINKDKRILNIYYTSKSEINNDKKHARSESKDYNFNYLSKKINNDILNEDKINKLGKKLYNIEFFEKNKYCEKCNKKNCEHCFKLSKNESEIFRNINKRILKNPLINTKRVSTDFNVINFNKDNNLEKCNMEINTKTQLSSKPDLKLDISNGMHNSQNNIQNININSVEEGNSNSNNFEIIDIDINNDRKFNVNDKKRIENKNDFQNKIQNNIIEIDNNENLNFFSDNKLINVKSHNKNEFNITSDNKINNEIIKEKNRMNNNEQYQHIFSSNSKEKNIKNNNKINCIEKENKEYNNNRNIKIVKLKGEPIKMDYINNQLQNISSILPQILYNINIITPKNYFEVKNQVLNLILDNDNKISMEFVNILYSIAINQIKFQPIYSKLFKDLDKFLNKKDKSKSIIRTQLMKYCKSNFKKIKTQIENIKYISSDINFIGELINAQMVSKKVGLQCLTHLINKFHKYNDEKQLFNGKEEKYLYLDNIINLLNKFATCIYCYQKEKIREDELSYFENEINQNIKILKEILKDEKNIDMPRETKINLINLIKKSENDWKLTYLEVYKDKILKPIYENINNENFNNTKNKYENTKK